MSYVKKTHRFGLLTPSSNTVQGAEEFSAALPPTVSLHTGRVAYRDITPQEQMRGNRDSRPRAASSPDAEVDVMVFAATAPTLANGKGYDRELIKRMEEASAGPPPRRRPRLSMRSRGSVSRRSPSARPGARPWTNPWWASWRRTASRSSTARSPDIVAGVELGRTGPQAAYELGRRRQAGGGRHHHAGRQLAVDDRGRAAGGA